MFKQLKRFLSLTFAILTLLAFGFTPSALAAPKLPQPNQNGDYIEQTSHVYWSVVDADPKGLNCRMGTEPIAEIWSPNYPGFPPIGDWPVVTTLQPQEVFQAELSYAGFATTLDQQFKPWIFINNRLDGTQANCFVRAHQDLVQPVAKPQ
jgi:hypothetical protein